MISINKAILFLALALSTATAISHGHVAARGNSHYAVARSVVDGLVKRDDGVLDAAIKRRTASNNGRCKPRPSSSSSSITHNATPPAKAVEAPHPQSSSSSSKWAAPSHAPAPKISIPIPIPKPSPPSTPNPGNGLSFNGGSATYYTQNGNAGACGQVHSDNDLICALFTPVYGGGKFCGKKVTVTNLSNGKTISVTVADECPTCSGKGFVDFSVGAYKALGGTVAEGMFPIKYTIEA